LLCQRLPSTAADVTLSTTIEMLAKNEEGATPLHLAAQLNKEKVIDALLEE